MLARFFVTRLKLVLTPSFFIVLLLFPLSVLAAGLVLNQPNTERISIGLIRPELPDRAVQVVIGHLEAYAKDHARIVQYDEAHRKNMEDDVAKGKLECGYILASEGITLIRSDFTMSDNTLNIVLASGYAETVSGELGHSVLESFFPDRSRTEMVDDIQRRADVYASSGPFMAIDTVWVGGNEQKEEGSPIDRVVHGLAALFVLLISLLGAQSLAVEKKTHVFDRVAAVGGGYYLTAHFLVLLAVNLSLFALCSVFGQLTGVIGLHAGSEAVMAFSYSTAVAAAAIELALWIGDESVYTPFIVFAFITAALFGGVLFSVEEVFSVLKPVPYFLLTGFYMSGVEKAVPLTEAAMLLLLAIFFGGLIWHRGRMEWLNKI